jgi:hypothetical protein
MCNSKKSPALNSGFSNNRVAGLKEFLPGSTADRLVRDAPCRVLMVKTGGKPY